MNTNLPPYVCSTIMLCSIAWAVCSCLRLFLLYQSKKMHGGGGITLLMVKKYGILPINNPSSFLTSRKGDRKRKGRVQKVPDYNSSCLQTSLVFAPINL